MTFLDRVEEANRHDLSAFCRWRIGDVVAGHVRTDLKTRLADCSDVFRLVGDDLEVVPALDDVQSRTEAVDALLPQLREDGFVAGAVGEQYGVVAEVGATPLMAIDRGAVEAFGVIATGFHLNGLVADAMVPFRFQGRGHM